MRFLATLALASLAALSLDISAAVASHFQYATMSWAPIETKGVDSVVVKINLRMGFRRNGNYAIPPGTGSFPGGCDILADPGDIIWDNQGPTYLDFGDGTFSSLTEALKFSVTSVDCAPGAEHNFLVADAINPGATNAGGTLLNNVGILHTYVGPGPFTAVLSSFPGSGPACCRIGQFPQFGFPCLTNRSEGPYPIQTNISPQSGNSSPVTSMPVKLSVPRGVASTFPVPGADPNGDAIQWRMSTDAEAGGGPHPPNMSINSATGLVTWDNSLLSSACAWTTQIMVEDLAGATVKTKSPVDFLLFICEGSPSAPVFAGGPTCGGTVTIEACQPYTFPLSASDADAGDVVSLAVSGLPVGASMTAPLPTSGNPVGSSFSWTPKGAQVGTHVITFMASDGCNQTLCNLTIVVTPSLTPPVFASGPTCNGTVTIKACQPYTFSLSGSDPNVGAVTLSVPSGLPVGATMTPALPASGNPVSSTFNWKPTGAQVGLHVLTFAVSDGCTQQLCTLKIQVIPNPTAPVFVGGPACGAVVDILVGVPYTFTRTASDVEASDLVTLTMTGRPAGATMTPALPTSGNPVASVFSWTPTAAQVGAHIMNFIASDGCNQSVCGLTIRVHRPPDCSQAVACVPTLGSPNHKYQPVTICGVTDPDGDPVTIIATGITQDEQVNVRGSGNHCPDGKIAGGQASVRAERSDGGNGRVYAISFTASDGRGGECQGVVYVCVPLDLDTSVACIDDGHRYDSTGPCTGGKVNPEVAVVPTEFGLTVGKVTGALATLEFGLPQDAQVELSVFDVAGRRLATVENGQLAAGVYQRAWDMSGATNGVYFVRLRAGAVMLTKTLAKIQ